MKHNSSFDDQIRSRLSGYEPVVPEHIWENIAAGSSKKRPVFWWWLNKNKLTVFMLALLIGGGGAAILLNNQTRQRENAGDTQNTIITANVENAPTGEKISEGQPGHKNTSQQAEAVKDKVVVSQANDATPSRVTGSSKANNDKVISDLAISADDKKAKRQISTTTEKIRPVKQEPVSDEMIVTEIPLRFYSQNRMDVVEVLKNAIGRAGMTSAEYGKKAPPVLKSPYPSSLNLPCPEQNAAGNKKYFEIYAGPDYAFRSFSDTGNSSYLQKRKQTTSFTSAYSLGLRFTRVFNNGMSLRTGLNFSQINERFKIVEGNVVQTVYITDISGDTIGSYSTVGTRYKVTHNRYHTIDLPLSVGYELGNGRLHTNFNAGVMVNIYSWQKGEVVDTASKAVVITTGDVASPYQFKTNIGLSFLGGVSVYYKLNNRFHLLAEPYFRYSLSPVNKSELTLKQKYHTAGLRLGLRFDLK